ncbi:type IX secretion system membrane protein PorP/SprF [Marivirga harenae]|uniref:PorP/SprF family type IX secretion system membrane protein n=1 Tax=Marivirga harenae TaxID=2010992 RepID=UPI0026E09683|nr:type IX secretion system membrane protein PorP/SprF [Marivirga harenae]WKV10631.1 type IX secretion system membrane protein PorP/SprF [Marivirga harenae]|tara:strand:+ start:610118 stop:611419 length:1302 start_codon:yes stop_codon:yes gene_type:complete
MSKFIFACLFFQLVTGLSSVAQELPVYNHFYLTPYLYNPAEAAASPYRNISLNQRLQWMGVEGAPMVSTLTFESPFDYKKYGLSATLRNFSRGLITTTDFLATYSYAVNLTKSSSIRFGISAGVTSNSIDFSQIQDLSDPAINNFLDNNVQPISNVGFKLETASGINIGAALPRLFKLQYANTQNFEAFEISPFEEFTIMAYYKKPVDYKLVTRRTGRFKRTVKLEDVYAPLQIYALYQYSQFDGQRIELLSTLNFNEIFWIGGSYRLNYGMSGIVGFNMQKLSLSYAYEPSSKLVDGIANGSHEIQLNIKIGDKIKRLVERPKLKSLERTEERAPRFSSQDVQLGGDEGEIKDKKYYVVVKEFNDFNSADLLVKKLKKDEDITADIFFNKQNGVYYVYIYETFSRREANKEKSTAEEITNFKNIKVIIVDVN